MRKFYTNQNYLILLGKILFATGSLAISSVAVEELANNFPANAFTSQANEVTLAQQPTRREGASNNALVPEAVSDAVIENLSAQTGTPISALRIIDAQQQTWSDSCLGLATPDMVCTKSLVPGWRVIVGSGQQRWVYRSNLSGSVVKLDAIASQSLAVTPPPPTRLPQPPARRVASSRTNQPASGQLPQVIVSEQPPNNPEIDPANLENQPLAIQTEITTPPTPANTTPTEVTTRPTPANTTPTETPTRRTEVTTRPTPTNNPASETPTRRTEVTTRLTPANTTPTETTTRRTEVTTRPTPTNTTPTETTTRRTEVTTRPTPTNNPASETTTRRTEVTTRPTPANTTPTETQATAPRRQLPIDRAENRTTEQANFSLTIRQPEGTLADIIARISLKAKNGNNYATERLIGDYRYRVNQQAFFRGPMKAGDRIVVRLYDSETKSLIGWSEFEIIPENAAVNLIFSNRPFLNRMVRTIYGSDNNSDGNIDIGKNVYDYYTQVLGNQPGQEQVIYLKGISESNLSWFQIAGLPVPPRRSVYPSSFAIGERDLTVTAYSSDLPRNISAILGRGNTIATLNENNNSFDISRVLNTSGGAQQTRSPQLVIPQQNEVSFADVPSNHWARSYIGQLAAKKIIEGFPDGLYQPNAPVTRAEFASILRKAFDRRGVRNVVAFNDVPNNHWAYAAIRQAYQMGFLDTDRSLAFNPDRKITRLDVLVALGKGLNYSTNGSIDEILRVYRDSNSIPSEMRSMVAAVTQRDMVVSYPNVKFLYPDRVATRAEVAALIYRALVSTGQATDIVSPYVVVVANTTNNNSENRERPTTPDRRRSNSN